MINTRTLLVLANALIYILPGMVLIGCSGPEQWQEEVKLSTGEIINIQREVEHRGGGGAWPQGQGSIPVEHIIRFQYPPETGQMFEWRSSKFDLPDGVYAELPLVLDVDVNKQWYIYTKVHLNEGCLRYVKYEFQENRWVDVPLGETIEPHPSNLFLGAGGVDIKSHVTLSDKMKDLSSIDYTQDFKQVGPKTFFCGYWPGT